jgi:hypothetical protein
MFKHRPCCQSSLSCLCVENMITDTGGDMDSLSLRLDGKVLVSIPWLSCFHSCLDLEVNVEMARMQQVHRLGVCDK